MPLHRVFVAHVADDRYTVSLSPPEPEDVYAPPGLYLPRWPAFARFDVKAEVTPAPPAKPLAWEAAMRWFAGLDAEWWAQVKDPDPAWLASAPAGKGWR